MTGGTRLPAYGRDIKVGLAAGLRPVFGGGGFIVTTHWDYAKPFARLICRPDVPVREWDFSFLRGCEVLVLVPEVHRVIGAELQARLKEAKASLVVLSVVQEDLP
jgi:hypothetical protein